MTSRITSGVPGLDVLCGGGLIANRGYLVRGGPGTGKTILCQQFAAAALHEDAPALVITLEESEEQYRHDAEAVGIDLSAADVLDLSSTPEAFADDQTYDLFSPAEVERRPMTQRIVEAMERIQPSRVVVDSMTRFRMYATNPYAFRRQVDSFIRYLLSHGATVMFVSEALHDSYDYDLCFMSDGMITLTLDAELRSIEVGKMRGARHVPGKHAVRITDGGLRVFPRLVPSEHSRPFERAVISSGVPELDRLLHGGIERGLVTLISGPSGAGKTTLGVKFLMSAAGAGDRAALFAFEEPTATLIERSESLGMPVGEAIRSGSLLVHDVEPLQVSSDELAHMVVRAVDAQGCRAVMLDSIAAYRLALRGDDLVERLHALCRYLRNMGVTVLLVNEVSELGVGLRFTEVGLSYLADNLIYLTYFEERNAKRSRVGRALAVAKKRVSDYDEALYELLLADGSITLRGPLAARGFVEGALVVES